MIVTSFALTACTSGSDADATATTDSNKEQVFTVAPQDDIPPTQQVGKFSLSSASWGSVEQPSEAAKPPLPTRMSLEAGKREAFERGAADRWNNTEVFVRR
ncbi:MAG: hypothetical protein ACYTGO_16085 [Planctomycetota bacterium]